MIRASVGHFCCVPQRTKNASRAGLRRCYLVLESGAIVGQPYAALSGAAWDALKASPPYSFIVSDGGIILARKVPCLGPSRARMDRAENRYNLRVLGRAAREQEAGVQ